MTAIGPAPTVEPRSTGFRRAVPRMEPGRDAEADNGMGLPLWTNGLQWTDLACAAPERECGTIPPGCDPIPGGLPVVDPQPTPLTVTSAAFRMRLRFEAGSSTLHISEPYRDAVKAAAEPEFEARIDDLLAAQLQDGACGGTSLRDADDLSNGATVAPAQAYGHLAATGGRVLHIPAIAAGAFIRDRLLMFINGRWVGPGDERVIVSAGYDRVGPGGQIAPDGASWVWISEAVDWITTPVVDVFPDYSGPDAGRNSLDVSTNTWRPAWEAYGMVRTSTCGLYAVLVDFTDQPPSDPRTVLPPAPLTADSSWRTTTGQWTVEVGKVDAPVVEPVSVGSVEGGTGSGNGRVVVPADAMPVEGHNDVETGTAAEDPVPPSTVPTGERPALEIVADPDAERDAMVRHPAGRERGDADNAAEGGDAADDVGGGGHAGRILRGFGPEGSPPSPATDDDDPEGAA